MTGDSGTPVEVLHNLAHAGGRCHMTEPRTCDYYADAMDCLAALVVAGYRVVPAPSAPSEPTLLVEDPPGRQSYSTGWTPSKPTP